MRTLFQLGKAYPANLALSVVVLALVVWFLGGAVVSTVQDWVTNREVNLLQHEAKAAQRESSQVNQTANETGIERRVNDRVRALHVTPELERLQKQSHTSRTRAQAALKRYAHVQKNNRHSALNSSALHERNCADLRNLYASERFDFCR